jgi:hypothetical protein
MSHGGNNHDRRIASDVVQQAKAAAPDAQFSADALSILAWNERMRVLGGPAQPSPTLGMAIDHGYVYLRVKCKVCK